MKSNKIDRYYHEITHCANHITIYMVNTNIIYFCEYLSYTSLIVIQLRRLDVFLRRLQNVVQKIINHKMPCTFDSIVFWPSAYWSHKQVKHNECKVWQIFCWDSSSPFPNLWWSKGHFDRDGNKDPMIMVLRSLYNIP